MLWQQPPVFLPSFLFVWILNPLVPKMCQSKFLSYFLDSVNIAAVVVIVPVLFEMSKVARSDWRGIAIAAISLLLTFGVKKVNAMWIVICGAIMD